MRSPRPVDAAVVAAWRVVPRLPAPLVRVGFALVADATWWRRGAGVRQLEANLARVRRGAGPRELRRLSRAGMRSYLRYWAEVFTLPTWSRERVVGGVRLEGEGDLRAALARGRGLVCFLGHSGNWDHLGAWGAMALGPVTTVVERLEPAVVFQAFLAYRTRLGITAVPHTGSPASLLRALRAGGIVPLVADRDLTGTGVVVDLFGEPARVAAGPAALALTSGAALFAVTCHTEARQRPRWSPPWSPRWGQRTVVGVAHEVPVPQRTTAGGRAQQVQVMTQHCVDHLAAGITAHPQEWHMLQRVFLADLDR